MGSLIFFVLLLGVMWALILRPQQKRMREHQQLVASLEPGDDVLLTGGVYGTITAIDGQVCELEISDGVVVRANRTAVSELIEWDDGTGDPSGD